jgi:hypothetical protein
MKREPGEKLIEMLDRIVKIGKRGKIAESVMLGTAIRVLPKAVSLRLCEMDAKGMAVDWSGLYQYVRCAEPYLDECINELHVNVVDKKKKDYSKKGKRSRWCKICMCNTHWTDTCFKIKNLVKNGSEKKNYCVKNISEEDVKINTEKKYEIEGNESEMNKKFYNYSLFNKNSRGNTLMIKINNKQIESLIDTGSDVNLIGIENINNDVKLENFSAGIFAANREALDVKGLARNVEIYIDRKVFIIDFIVVGDIQHQCILGFDFLNENVECMLFNNKVLKLKWKERDIKQELHVNKVDNSENKLFIEKMKDIGTCTLLKHVINTGNNLPICKQSFRLGLKWEEEIEKRIKEYLEAGIIRKSNSPWRSPIVPVRKKDGSLRMCIDYRSLNSVTQVDAYQMPRIDELFDTIATGRIFSKLDAYSGYHQIEMDPSSIPKTAFGSKFGHYEFVKMPFGLVNAPATFQRAMDTLFCEERNKFLVVYLDDIIVFSKNPIEHKLHLEIVCNKLKKAGIN